MSPHRTRCAGSVTRPAWPPNGPVCRGIINRRKTGVTKHRITPRASLLMNQLFTLKRASTGLRGLKWKLKHLMGLTCPPSSEAHTINRDPYAPHHRPIARKGVTSPVGDGPAGFLSAGSCPEGWGWCLDGLQASMGPSPGLQWRAGCRRCPLD